MGETEDERTAQAGQLFETFVQATTCKGTLQAFSILCRQMDLDPLDYTHFYSRLKAAISSWKVKSLWTKLDKRAGQKVYNHGEACQGTKCLIVGGGPCGLRTAIELALLGCKVVVIEKRDTFSRNNVLHLWPYTIHDLRALGAKNFYGKFCAGSLDHISIRQLQLMLIKVCLILGVEIHVNVEFVELLEPREDQSDSDSPGWRVAIRPSDHPVTEIDFDVVIGADGRKNTLDGFSRKEFRGKLAIAITANFVNRNTTAEASVEEISGVAFIFNQKFFLDLKEETGIDLENIVYYKDNTHYFVMTAKKQSLLDKGVILNDHMETERLLHRDNIDNEALRSYAREAADFGTNYQLPSLDYAVNSYDQPDVTMFDFTSMYASENAALLRERHGRQVLVALVGDSLLEPFWPMGTGCARGFLAAFDTAWMVRGWTQGRSPLDVLAERESLYRLLPQTTTENINKHFEQYSIEPSTRYPNLNSSVIRPHQVRHLLMNGQEHSYPVERRGPSRRSTNFSSTEAVVHQSELLTWCQKQTQDYRGVEVTDLGSSWRDGLALCSLIHHQRPDLIDFESLAAEDSASNNQLAFDLAEREFGIQPVTTGKELALEQQPDQLLLVLYLSKFYEAFRRLPGGHSDSNEPDENNEKSSGKTNHTLLNQPHHRKRIPKNDKKLEDNDSTNKKRRKGTHYLAELSCQSAPLAGTDGELQENKDRSMASLLAKFEENSSSTRLHNKSDGEASDPFLSPPPSPISSPSLPPELEEGDNPRFAKPKLLTPSPPPPPRPKWQPSIYLRLLEDPNAVARPTSPVYSPETPPTQNGFDQSPFLSWSQSPTSPSRSPSPKAYGVKHYSERRPAAPSTSHFANTVPSRPGDDHQAEEHDETHSQGKVSTREFTRRSIKERAGILCSMFPGSSTQPASSSSPPSPPPRPSPETELRTSSSSSSSSSSTNASKSLPLQRAIHSPIPHPSISGVSSTPLLPSHISHPPRGPEEKPDTSLPARPNESKHKHNPEKGHSSDKHRDNGHRGTPSPPAGSGVQRVCQTVAALSHTNDVCAAAQTMPAATTDGFKVNVERGEESFSGGSLGMLNGCKLTESVQEKSAGSGALFNSRRITRKPVARSDRCPAGPQKYSKERTVGKVSSAIDAKAQKLAILYETINRPNATPGSVRKATAPGLGGSDTCHFCLKRVYIMERLSAEGHFFHRECFRCAACGCTLRLGTHSFDSQQGNFYCKNHVKQRLGTKPDAFKKKMSDHNGVGTSGSSSLSSSRATNGLPAAGPHAPTSGGHAGLFVVSGQGAQKGLPGTCPVAGMVEEVLEATEASADTDSDPPCPDKSSRWKRKIRAAFPLLFVKRSSSEAKAGPAESAVRRQSIREEDSKDGQLLGGKQSAPSGNSGGVGGGDVSKALAEKRPVSSDRREEETAPVPSSGPKKRLMMTAFEKQKLLDWDLPLTSDTPTPRLEDQVPPMSRSKPDQSQTDVGRVEDPISDQTPASPLSTFQLFTNSLRKSFSGNRTSSSFNAAASVIIPTSSKPEGPHKPKVPSNSLFGLGSGQPQPESGKDLPAVMRGLSLAGQQGSAEGAFSDDMATLPPRRKLNFFSSLRLRKRDASQSESVEVDGQDKVRAILANLRNKASSEQHLEESLSSDDEEPCQSANQKVSLERQRKQQEKTVAQHAKREQLKRLHRAQAIQRHLEEVGERQRVVEERGVTLEKSLRGETGETHRADEETENQLHQSWFNLVLEKNRLARYESELMIFAQELELQDTQCRLQQDLRRKMAIEDTTKSASELQGEQELLSELMRTVERRDTLVSLLEEQRLSERDEDRDLESLSRGYELHWSPGQSLGWWDNLEGSGVEPGSQGDTLG
ncbi:F-actin-monooxygenase mical2b isoform X2 [Gadus macrocephalus]|uniref:F-actin-monooxygenase mical2b isoform X2 n=1 Tax=Gadus macrocephalus TaxID=80720 RepID=UPI0028CB2771|nr:F-actin-monooxygenase mical2b isoform X2 [Gadus macrocephalus]